MDRPIRLRPIKHGRAPQSRIAAAALAIRHICGSNGYIAPTANAQCRLYKVSAVNAVFHPITHPMRPRSITRRQQPYYGQNGSQRYAGQLVSCSYSLSPPAQMGPIRSRTLSSMDRSTRRLMASPLQSTSITERVNLRFNLDAFNALNMQGYANPNGTEGTEAVGRSSRKLIQTPRQVQLR